MNAAKKFPRWVTITILIVLLTQLWANSGLVFNPNLPRFPSVEAASSSITGTMSAVESGTNGTSSWSIGSNANANGTTIKVDIRIDGATPLTIWGWSVNINWTASILYLKGVSQGNFLSDGGSTLMVGNSPSLWDNKGGSILGGLACADSSSMSPETQDTSGVLATLTFLVIGYGTATITLNNDQLRASSSERTGTSVTEKNAVITVNKPTSATSGSSNGARIDVFTDHGGVGEGVASGSYAPLEVVQMYALVTYNNASVSDLAVSFCVQNANGSVVATRVAETNSSGIASSDYRLPSLVSNSSLTSFGTWSIIGSVNVSETSVSDKTTFLLSYPSVISSVQVQASVNAGETLPVKITINNLFNSSEWSELDVTLFDSAQIPIASYMTTNPDPAANQTVTAKIKIPSSAFLGKATFHICLLTADGAAVAPETVGDFTILAAATSSSLAKTGLSLVLPEYAYGGIIALGAAFAGFIAFEAFRKKHKPNRDNL